jgi:hypothetical protein
MKTKKLYTRTDLDKIRAKSPIIHSFLTAYERGLTDWNECLIGCIFHLHEANQRLEEMAVMEINKPPGLGAFKDTAELEGLTIKPKERKR